MTRGIAISITATKASSAQNRTAMAWAAKTRACSLPSLSRTPENSGTKAALKAPSANNRRNRLGNLKATKKASATGPAPRNAATRMSRTKPRIRLIRVKPPMVAVDLRKFMAPFVAL